MNKKKICLLGSSGSIGTQTLEVVEAFEDSFEVFALSVNKSVEKLKQQIIRFKPVFVCVATENHAKDLRDFISENRLTTEVMVGEDALTVIAGHIEVDIVVVAIVGTACLRPTYEAVSKGKIVCIACKEVLVAAGDMVMSKAKESGAKILPIDSEHAALKQCLACVNEDISQVEKLTLTASGGPFRELPIEDFVAITKQRALNHPNWVMGPKITIDSATLMNKGLEVIEAKVLFSAPIEKVKVVVHPQSVIHCLVEFIDGNVVNHLGLPDMRLPIQYALSFPDKLRAPWPKVDLPALDNLEFFEPDLEKFPLLALAYESAKLGGNAPIIINAANEAAVDLFLNDKLGFHELAKVVEKSLENHDVAVCTTINDIVALDQEVKEKVRETVCVTGGI